MSSLGFVISPDSGERLAALDGTSSFIVQAPAGSGKTELLIQRYLKLLGKVDRPERILAMTFTRKAAAEMRERILKALAMGEAVAPHEEITRDLATAALARDREMGWNLLENPGRIKVQTIDSMCGALVEQMPWLARQGAVPEIVDEAKPLYRSAAHKTVLMVEQRGRHAEWLELLLLHLDNKTARVAEMITDMLAKRQQWIGLTVEVTDESRGEMDERLEQAVLEAKEAVEQLMAPDEAAAILLEVGDWSAATEKLLTKRDFTWRKDLSKKLPNLFPRLESVPGLLENVKFLGKLPPTKFTDEQWKVLRALLEVLKLAAAQLWVAFQEAGQVDFAGVAMAAGEALGDAEAPTDLALKLDARIDHLLIDEFQDTSQDQFHLLEKLMAGWEWNDGRTLFAVGDPMQSIYRFRRAEVGLFLRTAEDGIGSVRPESLVLSANYRSVRGIVDWVNRVFGAVFPARNDRPTGAVAYSRSIAAKPEGPDPVRCHGFPQKDWDAEAERVVELVRDAFAEDPEGTVAILVRARPQLRAIVDALKRAGLSYAAVNVDSLRDRQCVLDLLSLTRAMLYLGDRISWLAVLRAPWCGLSLEELHEIAKGDGKALIYDLIEHTANPRAAKVRRILEAAFEQRGRCDLRVWVERTWRALGGDACLQTSGDWKDATDYFALLEKEQTGGALPDFDGFAARVEDMKAEPDPNADARLQVMTIHKSKGLQFDTVILPGLGRDGARDGQQLFLYHEGLLAPVKETGSNGDPIYSYLSEIEKTKSRNELVRQLYVAATRAKKRLHLMGYVGAKGTPKTGTMLAVLWDGLSEPERRVFADAAQVESDDAPKKRPVPIRRLPLDWRPEPAVPPVTWKGASTDVAAERAPTFEWVGDNLRHAGTAVHAILQRMSRTSGYRATAGAIRTALAQLGVPAADREMTARRVERAVERTLGSERGRWILDPAHADARSEMAIAAAVDGKIVRGTIDRTFVDQTGTRWVIDFKTSWHEGGGLSGFLDEEQRRYRPQLERYGRFFTARGERVRLGLYFPLLDEWREWGM
jgi:ATP-dependent exoDNAse (exonuclease V) beta subunit